MSVQETSWLDPEQWIGSVGSTFWLYPLIAGSYLMASSWSVGVAESAFLAHNIRPSPRKEYGVFWLEQLVRLVLIVNYSIACFAIQMVPWIGPACAFLLMSFVDGYFCFEQVWVVRGWSMEKRLRFAESHWSYLIGFGIPSTLVSFFHPSGLLNMMLFMLVFPFCTILAFLGDPQPQSTSFGAQTVTLPAAAHAMRDRHLSLLLPVRIPLFWPTVLCRRWLQARGGPPVPSKHGLASSKKREDVLSPASRSAASFVGGAWSNSTSGVASDVDDVYVSGVRRGSSAMHTPVLRQTPSMPDTPVLPDSPTSMYSANSSIPPSPAMSQGSTFGTPLLSQSATFGGPAPGSIPASPAMPMSPTMRQASDGFTAVPMARQMSGPLSATSMLRRPSETGPMPLSPGLRQPSSGLPGSPAMRKMSGTFTSQPMVRQTSNAFPVSPSIRQRAEGLPGSPALAPPSTSASNTAPNSPRMPTSPSMRRPSDVGMSPTARRPSVVMPTSPSLRQTSGSLAKSPSARMPPHSPTPLSPTRSTFNVGPRSPTHTSFAAASIDMALASSNDEALDVDEEEDVAILVPTEKKDA